MTYFYRVAILAVVSHILIATGCALGNQDSLQVPTPTHSPTSVISASPAFSKLVLTSTHTAVPSTSVPTRTPEAVSQESSKSSPVKASPTATPQPTYTPVPPKPVLATSIPEPTPMPVQVTQTPTPFPAAPRWENLRFTQAFDGARFQGDSGRPLDRRWLPERG